MERVRRHPLAPALEALLASRGPAGARELQGALEVSQPTFSRIVRSLGGEILAFGKGRARRYALPRQVEGVEAPVQVYEVRPTHEPRVVASLQPVLPRGFWVDSRLEGGGEHAEDIPWYLQDLSPSGFLGRLVPRQHPDLGVPDDIRRWQPAHLLAYAAEYGWNLPGAFIIGEGAYARWLEHGEAPPDVVDASRSAERYPVMAEEILEGAIPGSSAGGEQPKFLATRRDLPRRHASSDGRPGTQDAEVVSSGALFTPVIVKFSPPTDDELATRVRDLLVAEHLALETLGERGIPVAATHLVKGGGRLFLESERFDRIGLHHRRGVCSLSALDGAFVGSARDSWSSSVAELVRLGLLPPSVLPVVRMAETFGKLIGNTDMHFHNLSCYLDGTRPTGLAPLYDMLPMFHAPRHGELRQDPIPVAPPAPHLADVFVPALDAACAFWSRVAEEPLVSRGYRALASQCHDRLRELEGMVSRLPTEPLE